MKVITINQTYNKEIHPELMKLYTTLASSVSIHHSEMDVMNRINGHAATTFLVLVFSSFVSSDICICIYIFHKQKLIM